MARDYRYGAGQKRVFQRQSQQKAELPPSSSEGLTARQFWLVMIGLSLVLFASYFIASHFLREGVRGEGARLEKVAEPMVEKVSASEQLSDLEATIEQGEPSEQVLVQADSASLPASATPSETTEESAESEMIVPVSRLQADQKKSSQPHQIDYTFYEGLAKTEVVVHAEPLPVKLPQPYFIQAGSFGRLEAAEEEQARLRRFGFETQLSDLVVKDRTYYRLRLGPFWDRLEMNKVRNQLRDIGVDTLLIRVPKDQIPQAAMPEVVSEMVLEEASEKLPERGSEQTTDSVSETARQNSAE